MLYCLVIVESKYSTYDIRVRAVAALREGMAVTKVAKAYQVDRTTVYRWATRYQQGGGTQGLERRPVSGRPRILSGISNRTLLSIVSKPASR
jgi:transposase